MISLPSCTKSASGSDNESDPFRWLRRRFLDLLLREPNVIVVRSVLHDLPPHNVGADSASRLIRSSRRQIPRRPFRLAFWSREQSRPCGAAVNKSCRFSTLPFPTG